MAINRETERTIKTLLNNGARIPRDYNSLYPLSGALQNGR